MSLPLEGIRVLDLSKVMAGPLCAQSLGELGADVIKVESLGLGDDTRDWPPFKTSPDGQRAGAVFLSANRNKRSIAINLRTTRGREIAHDLARRADIVIESFGPGVAAKLAVDAASLSVINPRLIHCSISGFGTVGPMKGAKGYDMILQAFSGMMSMTGEANSGPVRSPCSPVDQTTGSHALSAILAALFERERTGHGKSVEVSLFDTALSFLAYSLQTFWENGTDPKRLGAGHESLCPYDAFLTADQPMILGVASDAIWRAFCGAAGLGDVVDDPRFRTNSDRVANKAETLAMVVATLRTRTRAEWMTLLEAHGVPCTPIHTLSEISVHPHTQASGMIQSYDHPVLGKLQGLSLPARFDGDRLTSQRPAPMHGQHTREILADLEYDGSAIESLLADGIVEGPGHDRASRLQRQSPR